ncbi:MAG: PfkB family carbohydrate kinase [Verrucomicrobiota bacterium]
MTPAQFQQLAAAYPRLRIAILGDFCLDRYLEIDPGRGETSIETGLRVHNVVHVRSQPGAAGTILNNLVALGIGSIHAVGFCGVDGEGFELQRALRAKTGVRLDHFLETPERRTFTYCKPLLMHPGKAPEELNRLDSKNWTPTPPSVQQHFIRAARELAPQVDAFILMDQVDVAETGVVTSPLLESLRDVIQAHPKLLIIADSRRGLRGYPPVCLKMNAAELARLTGNNARELGAIQQSALALARQNGRPVFITLSERGILAASPDGTIAHSPALPLRGEIDIVGAGDAVTANLTAALAAGASLRDAIDLANAAASLVIHQLGTTGTATVLQIRSLLGY